MTLAITARCNAPFNSVLDCTAITSPCARRIDRTAASMRGGVASPTLLSAMMAAGLPEAAYKRFAFGGVDWAKGFVLTERDELVELPDDT
jgi:hypothetical protein